MQSFLATLPVAGEPEAAEEHPAREAHPAQPWVPKCILSQAFWVHWMSQESMKLLKNILPESIIQRMQSGQKFVADSHQHVVILFSGEQAKFDV